MASPNKNPEYQAKLPRYGHDLSFDYGFTASTGMLLPFFHDILNPGEKVQGGVDIFTQLQVPLAVPAQIDMEQIVDYFFVPMPMLFQPFESMIYQTNDYLSSLYGNFSGAQQAPVNPAQSLPLFFSFDSSTNDVYSLIKNFWNDLTDYNWYNHDTSLPNRWCFEAIGRQAYRLFDMVGYNPDVFVAPWTDTNGDVYSPLTDFNPNVFPYALLAYQCVYQYFYRVDQWERFDNQSFNWDGFYSHYSYSTAGQMKILQLRYRPKYLDYFTNVKPSPYLQGSNMLRDSASADNSANILVNFEKWLSNDIQRPVNEFGSINSSGGYTVDSARQVNNVTLSTGQPGFYPNTFNGTQALRNLRAADKFLQITARAANRYDDQVLAHLGYKVPHDIKHNIKYLGSQRKPFKINQVVSTDSTNLGERAGYATGSITGKGFDFTAPCHGVLIGIYSTMVKPRYIAGFDRANVVRNIHDFWQPEYDNLGMQPVFDYELQRMHIQPTKAATIAGWQWRYEEKKRKYSRVSSAFRKYMPWAVNSGALVTPASVNQNPLSAYFNITQPNYQPFSWGAYTVRDQTISNDYMNDPSQGVIENEFPSSFSWDSMLVPPSQLNNVLGHVYDDAWHYEEFAKNPALIYQYDPFIIDMHVNYKKVSPMSVHSMPNINE